MSLISRWKSQTNMNRKPAVYHWICCSILGKIKGTWTTERVLGLLKDVCLKASLGKKKAKPETHTKPEPKTNPTNKQTSVKWNSRSTDSKLVLQLYLCYLCHWSLCGCKLLHIFCILHVLFEQLDGQSGVQITDICVISDPLKHLGFPYKVKIYDTEPTGDTCPFETAAGS